MSEIFEVNSKEFNEKILKVFDLMNLRKILKKEKRIVLKPNLTKDLPYPITTDPNFVEIIIKKILSFYKGEIFIAEGSGGCDTNLAFLKLGYQKIAEKFKIKLIDLNRAERIKVENKNALVLKSIWLPKIILDSFLISLPVPKDHSSAVFTCSLKNMIGVFLSQDYVKNYDQEKLEKIGVFVAKEIWQKGWNKGELHEIGLHQAIFDLNLYKKPDLTICDARYKIKGSELGGKKIKLGKIFFSFDPVALDSYLAKLFKSDWQKINYLVFSNKKIGQAEKFQIIKV